MVVLALTLLAADFGGGRGGGGGGGRGSGPDGGGVMPFKATGAAAAAELGFEW